MLQKFKFEARQVRAHIDEQGNPWFAAVDVCRILGIQNPSNAVKSIPEKHRNTLDLIYGSKSLKKTRGNLSAVICVSEPGLYRLIMRSNKPEAVTFQDWIYEVVLPSIRKTGSYSITQPQELNDWQKVREEGKRHRRAETDAIKDFIAYSGPHGSRGAKAYYARFSMMVNSALLKLDGGRSPKKVRDLMNTFQLHAVSVAETVIANTLRECMDRGLHYSEIYRIANEKIALYGSVVGKSDIRIEEPVKELA